LALEAVGARMASLGNEWELETHFPDFTQFASGNSQIIVDESFEASTPTGTPNGSPAQNSKRGMKRC
jgi:hypothetical protein